MKKEKNDVFFLVSVSVCTTIVILLSETAKGFGPPGAYPKPLRVSFHPGLIPSVCLSVCLSVCHLRDGSRMYVFPGSHLSVPGHTSHSYKIQQRRRTCTHARQKKHEFGHRNGQTGKIKNRKPVHTHTRERAERRDLEREKRKVSVVLPNNNRYER